MTYQQHGERVPRAWLVRGGRDGEREERALKEDRAIVGWSKIGDVVVYESWNELTEGLREACPEANRNLLGVAFGRPVGGDLVTPAVPVQHHP
ncbi:hypothetical protein ACFVH6_11390 [Spirillospora sp. NPDC127200]